MKFTGHERDLGVLTSNADDLDYMHARFCSPLLGRFLSVDPVGGNAKIPQTWNRYAYAADNPLKYTDPTGEATGAQLAQAGQDLLQEFEENAFAASDGSAMAVLFTWQISNTVDGLDMVLDLFKAGDATGTAIGSGAGALDTTLAVGHDALRTAGLVAPLASAGRALATRSAGAAASELSGVGPGAYAEESIAARSSSQSFTAAERSQINKIGSRSGCHTCGTTNPGTRSGNFVPDHQPPTALNPPGAPQRLYPQCINCSRNQGLEIARRLQRGGQS
jgi:RHS repeat-associated protein